MAEINGSSGEVCTSKSSGIKLLVCYSDSSDSENENLNHDPALDLVEPTIRLFPDADNKAITEVKETIIDLTNDRRSVSSFESDETSSLSSSEDSSDEDSSDTSSSESSENKRPTNNSSTSNLDDEQKKKRSTPNLEIRKKPQQHVKTKGELDLKDLPPIGDLKISVEKDALRCMGLVLSIVDCLVTIQADAGVPALNLDTMVFFENGDAFGEIFDVFGPVTRPLYAVRFNSNVDIVTKNIYLKMPVYYAPQKEQFTNFVFVDQLKSAKGCDASWKHDNEPPEDQVEFSDDEEERNAKAKFKGKTCQDSNIRSNEVFRKRRSKGKFKNVSHLERFTSEGVEINGSSSSTVIRPPTFNYSWGAEPSHDMFGQCSSFPTFHNTVQQASFFRGSGIPTSPSVGTTSPFLIPQPSTRNTVSVPEYQFGKMTASYQDKFSQYLCVPPPPPPPPPPRPLPHFPLLPSPMRLQTHHSCELQPSPSSLSSSLLPSNPHTQLQGVIPSVPASSPSVWSSPPNLTQPLQYSSFMSSSTQSND